MTLTLPQIRHLERCADLLVVAPRRKTLAQLALQELDGVDPSNLADFLRQSTVRRLNRDKRRRHKPRLHYRSKLQLAQEMLQQVIAYLPAKTPVYVLFDSWYTSAKLVTWIRQRGWHVIAALKSNRKVSGQKLTDHYRTTKGRSYDRVSLELANKRRRTYWTRTLTGRLAGVADEIRVVISQRGPGVRSPKYFLCTDTKLSAQAILTDYQLRWSQEVDYWHVKLQLGLGDFRLQSYEAIAKWYAMVYLVLVYLYWYGYEQARGGKTRMGLSEVLSRIRQDHQREVLRAACAEVAGGASVEAVVTRYAGPASVAAA